MGLLTSAFQRIIGVKEFADHITLSKGYKCKKMVIPVNTGASDVEVFPPYPAKTVEGMLVTFVKTDTGAGQVKVSGLSSLLPWASTYLGLYQAITLVATPMGWWPHSGVIAPVSGEPSLGTLKHHPLTNTTSRLVVNGTAIGAGAWSAAIDCSAYGAAGEKAILADVLIDITSTTSGDTWADVAFSDNNSTTPTNNTAHPHITARGPAAAASQIIRGNSELIIPVSATRTFYFYGTGRGNAAGVNVYVILKGYAS